MHHYRSMSKHLLELLDTDPQIAQSMACITSEIEFSEQIISLLEHELDYVIDALKHYYVKYDEFKDIKTFNDLAQRLHKELEQTEQFLQQHHTVDSEMFKNSIFKLQLIKLIDILERHGDFNPLVLQHIIQHPYLDKYISSLDSQSGWFEVGHINTHFVNMLLFLKLIPDIHDFYKSAPKLYSLVHDKSQSSVVRHAANEVLKEWGSYVVSSRDYTQALQISNPDVHIVSKDPIINYVFSSLLHIGVPLEEYVSKSKTSDLKQTLGEYFDLMTLQYADGIHYMLAHLQKTDFIVIFSDKTILDRYCQLRLATIADSQDMLKTIVQDKNYVDSIIV
ncbi:hypothetical protein JA1_002028 [Spathaspora sp. JA1]|nr:hypothetical protein JA1_002028 [Spathaspora sp. JA1]